MLRTGNQIRLNRAEKDRLTTLTGANTDDVKSIEALNNFVDFHKGIYAGDTPEEKLLKHLLEQEKITP